MRRVNNFVPTASAYAALPENDGDIPPSVVVDGTCTTPTVVEETGNPLAARQCFFVATEFLDQVPEVQGVTWQDDFFEENNNKKKNGLNDNDHDIVAVFDLDYERMQSHYQCWYWSGMCVAPFFFGPSTIPLTVVVPMLLSPNVRLHVQAQHIALTCTGILWVQDQRPLGFGCDCGKLSSFIGSCTTLPQRTEYLPYEQMDECKVVCDGNTTESAYCSVLTGNPLTLVQVSSTLFPSSSSCNNKNYNRTRRILEITGLKDPYGFSKLAMALKQRYSKENHIVNLAESATEAASATGRIAMVMEDRGIANSNKVSRCSSSKFEIN